MLKCTKLTKMVFLSKVLNWWFSCLQICIKADDVRVCLLDQCKAMSVPVTDANI